MKPAAAVLLVIALLALLFWQSEKSGFRREVDDGMFAYGDYVEGKRHGLWLFQDRTTRQPVGSGEYEAGIKHGKWTYYYVSPPRQCRASGEYAAGKKTGFWRFYMPTGEVDPGKTGLYEDGAYLGPKVPRGPWPTPAAAAVARKLGLEGEDGVVLEDRSGQLGGGRWRLSALSTTNTSYDVMMANMATDELLIAPIVTEGDVAWLYRCVTGEDHPTLDATISAQLYLWLEERKKKEPV